MIGNFFGRFFGLYTNIMRHLQHFPLLLSTKIGKNNVLQNHGIEKCFQVLDTCFAIVDWPNKNLSNFHQFFNFPSFVIFLNFQI